MHRRFNRLSAQALLLLPCLVLAMPGAVAEDSIGEPGRGSDGPNPLNNVYFGEQHLHTSASPDAFAFGTRNDADDAYRYAKGEAIKNAQTGEMIQKRTPYDWAAVTDHAEYLGMMPLLLDPNSPLQETEIGKLIASGDPANGEKAFQQIITSATINEPIDYMVDPEIRLASTGSVAGEPAIYFGTPAATGVWAPENTREAIFDGLKRKETYGTSGTLIRVRFFGGWAYPDDLTSQDDFVATAYEGGVPMGGDLPRMPDSAKAPTFAVWALKDPESGNLDRIQIVKGWYDKRGYGFQKIYDVAWSGGDKRQIDKSSGKLPPVGNTVDVTRATYTNDIGATQLRTLWTDPDFDPTQHAMYYARVIEIPTPRWSTYDAVKLGVEPPKEVSATIQERAWTSPIWYTPAPDLIKRPDFYPGLQEKLPPSGFHIGTLEQKQ